MKLIVFVLTFVFLGMTFSATTGLAKDSQSIKKNAFYEGKSNGESTAIQVVGVAQITSAGAQDAFDRALSHAMRKAVEQVLGTLISSETIVKNATLIDDSIYSRSTGFVKRYQILDDSNKSNTKVLKVRVWVVATDVENNAMALGMLQDRVSKPYILVVVDETPFSLNGFNSGSVSANYTKNAVQQFFIDKEFQFVEESQLQSVLKRQQATLASLAKKNRNTLSEVALQSGAEVIISAKVSAAQQTVRSLPKNWISIRATVNLDAIYTSDATIIASASASQAAATIDVASAYSQAIQKASKIASAQLFSKIITKWSQMLNQGFEYTVLVSGVSYQEARQIKLSIDSKIEGVKQVLEREFSNNNLELLVRFSGKPSNLVSLILAKNKMPFPLELNKYDFKSIVLYKIKNKK